MKNKNLKKIEKNLVPSLKDHLPDVFEENLQTIDIEDLTRPLNKLMTKYKLPLYLVELRKNFWEAIKERLRTGKTKKISHEEITQGDIQEINFMVLIQTPGVLAYILQKPKEEVTTISDIQTLAMDQMREIASLPAVDSDGNVDHQQFDRLQKILALINRREEMIYTKFPERLDDRTLKRKQAHDIKRVREEEEEYLNNIDISKIEMLPKTKKDSDDESSEDLL